MYKILSVALVAFAISTPAHADVFGLFASNGGADHIVDVPIIGGHAYGPAQSSVKVGAMHGYPFHSGCCESKSPCSAGLWSGFCASRGSFCGRAGCGGCSKGGCSKGGCSKGGCGLRFGHVSCGKGGCGGGCGMTCGHRSCGKGSCGFGGCGKGSACGGHACGSKGCGKGGLHHGRLGLFDWMQMGCGGGGHSAHVKGGYSSGCSSCGGGTVEYGSIHGHVQAPSSVAPSPSDNKDYLGTPTEVHDASPTLPPPVIVEPTSVSDRSAWRRMVPSNPFVRPLGY